MGCSVDIKMKNCHKKKGCCVNCKYAIKTVYDEIISFDPDKLAIYLHSFEGQNYTVKEIKDLLNKDASDYH